MDRGAWWPTVYGGRGRDLKKSDRLSDWECTHDLCQCCLISQNLCRASTYLPFWDVVVGEEGVEVIEGFFRSAEGLWCEWRLDHKTYVLTHSEQTRAIHPLQWVLYSTFALPCCSPRLILGKMCLQLGLFFPSLTALRSVASSPTSTLVSGMASIKNWGIPWGLWTSLVAQMVKNLPEMPDPGLIPGSGRFFGEGHDYPLQYSCMENSMNRGAWSATLHRVAKSWTWLKWLGALAYSHTQTHTEGYIVNCLSCIR